jgi:membrane dipeptidase
VEVKRGFALVFALAAMLADSTPGEAAAPAIPVVDLHVDIAYQHNYQGKSFAEATGQYRASELLGAGVAGVVLPLFVPHKVSPSGPRAQDYEDSYARVFNELARTEPFLLPGCNPAPGKVRTWLAFEGAAPLADDPDPQAVLRWVARGVRSFGLVHTKSNALASSSNDANPSYGLTEAGRRVVRAVHAAGAVIDISHASDRAAREILALGTADGAPVMATHSNARAVADHPRNLSDDLLQAVAKTGGVVGVNFHSPFLARGRAATLADVVKHVRHLVKVMGVEHVALGSDFEGDITPAAELTDVAGFRRLATALESAGFPRSDVEKMFSANALRVLCRVPAQP